MKVFWSWQSDTPGRIGRFLIRDALREAIDQLKQTPEIEDAAREGLHVDQDIQDVPGSPDLASTIFEKISKSMIVVADVTPIGRSGSPATADAAGKKLINSNVAIELGYALRAVSDNNVLLVFNEHYGSHEELPFDLRHKGGSIVFNLAPDADKGALENQQRSLKARFVQALKPYLASGAQAQQPFLETPSTFCKATYFEKGDALAVTGSGPKHQVAFSYGTESLCYLRLIPASPLPSPLPLAVLMKTVQYAPLLTRSRFPQTVHNQFGAIRFEPVSHPTGNSAQLDASTQLFQNGEAWSISSSLIRAKPDGEPQGTHFPFLPTLMFEQLYYDTLRSLVDFAKESLHLPLPWSAEAGLIGIKGCHLPVKENQVMHWWGPIFKSEVVYRSSLKEGSDSSFTNFLLSFFCEVYDSTGRARPEGLFGFPPKRPGGSLF